MLCVIFIFFFVCFLDVFFCCCFSSSDFTIIYTINIENVKRFVARLFLKNKSDRKASSYTNPYSFTYKTFVSLPKRFYVLSSTRSTIIILFQHILKNNVGVLKIDSFKKEKDLRHSISEMN